MKRKKSTSPKPKIMPSGHVAIQIDNPLYNAAHSGEAWNPKIITAAFNIHESSISRMAHKKLLTADQVAAASRFRMLWEQLGGSGAGSMDYTKEPVDGGGAREPISDRQIDAGRQLKKCRELLGIIDYDIMSKIAGQGLDIRDIAKSQRDQKTVADRLKGGLDVLAEHFGYKTALRSVKRTTTA